MNSCLNIRKIIGIIFLSFTISFAYAQKNADTTEITQVKKLSRKDSLRRFRDPVKASLYAAVLPGLGQVYNKKYWKVPILYSGIFALGYYINENNRFYKEFRDAYAIRESGGKDKYRELLPNSEQLLRQRESYRRDRDFLIIISAFTYLLNIADAAVDAHLSGFSVADDLELSFQPEIRSTPYGSPVYAAGVKLKFLK